MNDPTHPPRRVSVILPALNGERFLAQSLESVKAQTLQPFETIIVDGGSTDGTIDIARLFAGVRLIRQAERGIADACNEGIAASIGDFIAFQSCDDVWTPDKLHVQVGFLQSHPKIQFTAAHVKYFLEPGRPAPSNLRPELLEGVHPGRFLETLVARRAVFDRVGGFDTRFAIAVDVDWYSRCGDAQIPMATLPNVLLHKRIHGNNLSMNTARNNLEILEAMHRSIRRKAGQSS